MTIPGGAYNAATKIGWKVNGSGTSWTYKNSGTCPCQRHPQGAAEGLSSTPGKYKFGVKGKNGNYAVNTANLPLVGTLVIDVPYADDRSVRRGGVPGAADEAELLDHGRRQDRQVQVASG